MTTGLTMWELGRNAASDLCANEFAEMMLHCLHRWKRSDLHTWLVADGRSMQGMGFYSELNVMPVGFGATPGGN